MTAICGSWRFDGADPQDDVKRLLGGLAPYGRDGESSCVVGTIALGRRLSTNLPEDVYDTQPYAAADRRYIVVADVRLTERNDLVKQLGLDQDLSALLSDAAIVAEAIERWHEETFDRIYGDFAIAAWDRKELRLLLARDPIGQKPLFHHRNAGFFAFASMPTALQALPDVPKGPDVEEMAHFLSLSGASTTRSFYATIERVMPGHCVTITATQTCTARYWNPDLTPLKLDSHDAYADALRDRLETAVQSCLRGAGNKVAAHLSGGFDSAAVASTAARILASQSGTVVAFTSVPREGFGVPDPKNRFNDEGAYAAATAAMHPNMEHVLIRTSGDVLAGIDRSAMHAGPILNVCNAVWADAINAAVRERHIGVLLVGDMGNATISETGTTVLAEQFAARAFRKWFRTARAMVRRRRMRWRGVVWNTLAPFLPIPVYRWGQKITGRDDFDTFRYTALKREKLKDIQQKIADQAKTAQLADRVFVGGALDLPPKSGQVQRMMILSCSDAGPHYKGMLGIWEVDCRDPTADRRLIEFSLRVPTEQLYYDGEARALLRKVLADRVAPIVLENRRKGYQGADWYEGLERIRGQLAEEIERAEMFGPSNEILDVARLKQLLAEWPKDGWNDEGVAADYRHALLRGISAAHFMRKAAGSNY